MPFRNTVKGIGCDLNINQVDGTLGDVNYIQHNTHTHTHLSVSSFVMEISESVYSWAVLRFEITKIKNMFWKDVLNSWVLFPKKFTFVNEEEILFLNIWNNIDILINIKPEIYKNYFEKCVIVLYDLLDSHGRFMDYDTFSTKYNIRSNMTSDVTNTVKKLLQASPGRLAVLLQGAQERWSYLVSCLHQSYISDPFIHP